MSRTRWSASTSECVPRISQSSQPTWTNWQSGGGGHTDDRTTDIGAAVSIVFRCQGLAAEKSG